MLDDEQKRLLASLGLPQEVMEQQLGTLSGGQRRRIERARADLNFKSLHLNSHE